MKEINLTEVKEFVKTNIGTFHLNRLKSLEDTDLKELLKKKNPYLFKAKNLVTAQDLVTSFLDAKLSSSEEEIFGAFLEDLALFVAKKQLNAVKSSSHGIDFEYTHNNTRYLVSIKSGLNWGNSSQWKRLEDDFKMAMKILSQSSQISEIKCILGVSYGKQKRTLKKGYINQICGQEFWFEISGKENFYKEIVEPIGYKSKELNDNFLAKKVQVINKFTKEFLNDFCNDKGIILWGRLVEFNSGNLKD